MRRILGDFFKERNIEYFSVLDFRDVTVTSSGIMERESFTPRSVIIYLLPYYTGECKNISRYAASLDYHLIIRRINSEISDLILRHFPTASLKGYGDHSPIDERDAALRAGLGILGDNGLLINESYGTYVFIADVITDVSSDTLGAIEPTPILRCEGCGACRSACPTGALRGESYECLSAITQKKGELTEEEAALMRKYDTAWGCDVCQEVCPHNLLPRLTPIELFREGRIDCLTEELVEGMTKEEFASRAFAWRGKKTVLRNLKILGEDTENSQ